MATTGFDMLELRPLDTGLIFVFMALGPSTSGLALTALLEGRAGLRRLVAHRALWRLGLRWYLVGPTTMLGRFKHAKSAAGRADARQLHRLAAHALHGHVVGARSRSGKPALPLRCGSRWPSSRPGARVAGLGLLCSARSRAMHSASPNGINHHTARREVRRCARRRRTADAFAFELLPAGVCAFHSVLAGWLAPCPTCS